PPHVSALGWQVVDHGHLPAASPVGTAGGKLTSTLHVTSAIGPTIHPEGSVAGTSRHRITRPTAPTPPIDTAATDRVAAEVTAAISNGPPTAPTSLIRRHTPRKRLRPSMGDRSEANVMFIPDPRPLARPMTIAIAVRAARVDAIGMRANPRARRAMNGVNAHLRPLRSMRSPTG